MSALEYHVSPAAGSSPTQPPIAADSKPHWLDVCFSFTPGREPTVFYKIDDSGDGASFVSVSSAKLAWPVACTWIFPPDANSSDDRFLAVVIELYDVAVGRRSTHIEAVATADAFAFDARHASAVLEGIGVTVLRDAHHAEGDAASAWLKTYVLGGTEAEMARLEADLSATPNVPANRPKLRSAYLQAMQSERVARKVRERAMVYCDAFATAVHNRMAGYGRGAHIGLTWVS